MRLLGQTVCDGPLEVTEPAHPEHVVEWTAILYARYSDPARAPQAL